MHVPNSRVIRPKTRASSAGAAEQGMTFGYVLSVARQWWKLVLPAGLLLAAAGGLLVYATFVPQFEAAAWLRIDEHPNFLAFETRTEGRSSSFLNTQIELLRSPLVLSAVAQQPEVARLRSVREQGDLVAWLGKQLRIRPVGESELLKVSLATPRPDESAQLINAVVATYFKLRSADESERHEQILRLLEEERDRRVRELAALRASLQRLTEQAGVKGLPPVAPLTDPTARQTLAELQTRLIDAEVEEQLVRARLRAAEHGERARENELPAAVIDRIVDENVELRQMTTALADKQLRLGQIEARSARGVQDPLFRQLQDEVQADTQALEKFRAEKRRQVRAEMAATVGNQRSTERSTLQAELESRSLAVKLLRERNEAQFKELAQGGVDRSELAAKQAELDRAEKVFEQITERVAKLRTEQRAPGRVTLMRPAEPPPAPLESFPLRNVLAAVLAGLGLPFALAVGFERLLGRVIDAETLQRQAALPLLGEIPRVTARELAACDAAAAGASSRQLAFAESFDALRAGLLLADEFHDPRVVAATSATSGEGKTSVAAHLALSIARATGLPTLLVDGDLWAPRIHTVLNTRLEPGLAQVLTGKCALEEAIVANPATGVDVLPAGKLWGNAQRLLAPDTVRRLLDEARGRYGYVILDTPPLLAASEALVLAKAADACLMCALMGKSRNSDVHKARERLEGVGGRVAGIVLSDATPSVCAYRYRSEAREQRGSEVLCRS